MFTQRWLVYAVLSALSASLIAVFGKWGMKGVDSNLATALRSIVQTVVVLGVCTALGVWSKASALSPRPLAMIALSGAAGAASWLFYFKALQLGTVSHVAPIDKLSMPLGVVLAVVLLGERPSGVNWAGIALIAVGAYLAARPAG